MLTGGIRMLAADCNGTEVVVPKPDPPVGTSVALVSLPLPDPRLAHKAERSPKAGPTELLVVQVCDAA